MGLVERPRGPEDKSTPVFATRSSSREGSSMTQLGASLFAPRQRREVVAWKESVEQRHQLGTVAGCGDVVDL